MFLGSLRSKVSSWVFLQWFQACVSKASFFSSWFGKQAFLLPLPSRALLNYLFSLNSLSSLSLTNSVPVGAQGFQEFIVLFCRVYYTFLSGLLYFFVGSIILFCRVYLYFCDFIKYIMVRDKAFTFYKKYICRDKKIIVGAILWQADGTKRKL